MSLQEARNFTARFVTGYYTTEEYAAFLQWLKVASVKELTVIAGMHESNEGKWVLPDGASAGWVAEMEQKLNARVGESSWIEGEEETTVMDMRAREEEFEEIAQWRDEEAKEAVVPPVGRM